ncbi:MAG: hypothetical protein ACLQU2_37010 [Candidatus Binataceae bacterium]
MTQDAFAPLVGQMANGCWLGVGSVLFLEFGALQPAENAKHHPRGELALWADSVSWRLEQGERVIAGSCDDRATMNLAIERINGAIFVSGELLPSGDSKLLFSGGLTLRTFVDATEEDARWVLRNRDGNVGALGPERVQGRTGTGTKIEPESITRSEAHGLPESSTVLMGTEVWQIWIDAIHQLQDGYSAGWVRELNLDLLQPLPLAGESHRRPMGTLSVEADAGGFRLERAGEILVASDDSSGKALAVFPQLLGRTLLRVEASPPAREAVFHFDDDLALRCFPANSQGRTGWSLHPSNADSTRTR